MRKLFYKIKDWWMRYVNKKRLVSEDSNLFLEDVFNYLFRTDEWLQYLLEDLDRDEEFTEHWKDVFHRRNEVIKYLVDREKAFLSYICNILQRYLDGEVEIDLRDHEKYVWSLGEEQIGKTTRKIWIRDKIEIPNED